MTISLFLTQIVDRKNVHFFSQWAARFGCIELRKNLCCDQWKCCGFCAVVAAAGYLLHIKIHNAVREHMDCIDNQTNRQIFFPQRWKILPHKPATTSTLGIMA
jgi:hypothetical protein